MRGCVLGLVASFTGLFHGTASIATDAPVIGILTVPIGDDGCITMGTGSDAHAHLPLYDPLGSCFHSLYSDWIAAAGGRVVPLRYDAPLAELKRLFGSVNGVLFTGGETNIRLLNSTYLRAARQLFDLAVEAHAMGDHVPLWGTCMGFQTLAVLAAGSADALTSRGVPSGNPGFDSEGISLPLRWAPNPRGESGRQFWSRFANGLAAAEGLPSSQSPSTANTPALRYLTVENITSNLHHDGVEPSSFARIQALGDFFDIVSTNYDLQGKEFVSTMEAASGAPIYGVQWHPERNAYQFSVSAEEANIDHSLHAIHTVQTVANWFVGIEARKNSHAFEPGELQDMLWYNFNPVGPKGDSYRAYIFSPYQSTTPSRDSIDVHV